MHAVLRGGSYTAPTSTNCLLQIQFKGFPNPPRLVAVCIHTLEAFCQASHILQDSYPQMTVGFNLIAKKEVWTKRKAQF